MGKVILQTLFGLACWGLAILFIYLYLQGGEHRNILFLAPVLFLFAGGAYLLYLGGKSDSTVIAKPNLEIQSQPTGGLAATLKKNNEMFKDWTKTDSTRNKLKMLQTAGEE